MKKTYFAILGAAAILSLATACSSQNVNESTANESSQSASSESSSNGMDESSPTYDPDERGTVLSVNHDPAGNAVTYAGYLLLCAGLVGSLTQKGSRFRTLLEKLDRSIQTTDAHEAETL